MSTSRSRVPAIASAAVLAAFAHDAFGGDANRAAALFTEGRQALASGNYTLACKKFADSQAEDPREGTLINLALCEESLGKVAEARQYWQQARDLAAALADPRADYDAQQFARIDGRVPRLDIRLEGAAPPATEVMRDGIEFGSGSLGVPLPVDPGAHVIRATAIDHEPREFRIELREGETRVLAVGPGPSLPPSRAPAPPTTDVAPGRAGSMLRAVAYGAGALGVLGLGIGATFGVRAAAASSAAAGHCQGNVCDATGTAARNEEASRASVATIGLVTGAGLVVGASLLWALTPTPAEAKHQHRNVTYVLGATGLVTTVLGGIFGLHAIQANRNASYGCDGNVCDPQGFAARRDAISSGDAATVLLASGGAVLAGAISYWALGADARPSTP